MNNDYALLTMHKDRLQSMSESIEIDIRETWDFHECALLAELQDRIDETYRWLDKAMKESED